MLRWPPVSLYRRPRSPFWWSKLHHEGDLVRFSTGERNKTAALRVERDRASELASQSRLIGRYSLATLSAKFLAWKEADGRSDATVAMMRRHIKDHILPSLGAEKDVRSVTVAHLEEYKTDRMAEVEGVTVAKELSTLRQVLRYAAEVHGIMKQAPTVRNPRIHSKPAWKLMTAEQVSTILEYLSKIQGRGKEALPYFLLLANTGMRGGEASRITWEMVDQSGGALHLPAAITKTRRARTVPLNQPAQAAIEIMRTRRGPTATGRVFEARAHYTSWRKACAAAGVAGARPHDLRHTFGSLLHAAGRSGPEVRDVLGHVTMHMANLYAHTFAEKLSEAVQAVQISVPTSVPKGRSSRVSSVPVLVSSGRQPTKRAQRRKNA